MFGIPGVGVDRQLLGTPNNVVHGVAKFNQAGTFSFTVPDGVWQLLVDLVGGGGGGAGGSSGQPTIKGGDGGLNSLLGQLLNVIPGQTFTVTIGAGGAGGAGGSSPSVGSAGGTTSFGSVASVAGGGGGNTQTSQTVSACVYVYYAGTKGSGTMGDNKYLDTQSGIGGTNAAGTAGTAGTALIQW
jgi:hypothetical protein